MLNFSQFLENISPTVANFFENFLANCCEFIKLQILWKMFFIPSCGFRGIIFSPLHGASQGPKLRLQFFENFLRFLSNA